MSPKSASPSPPAPQAAPSLWSPSRPHPVVHVRARPEVRTCPTCYRQYEGAHSCPMKHTGLAGATTCPLCNHLVFISLAEHISITHGSVISRRYY